MSDIPTISRRGLPGLPAVWRDAALWLLILAAAANGEPLEVAGLNVAPEHLALGLVLPIVAFAVFRGELDWRWPRSSSFLLAWLGVGLLASVIHAPNPARSVLLWNKLWMMVVTYVVVANLSRDRLLEGAGAQCVAGVLVAACGILAVVGWHLFGSEIGMQRASGGGRVPHGLLAEANIFGSYLLASTLLAGALAPSRSLRKSWLGKAACSAVILGIPGLVLSMTRSAWVGLVSVLWLAGLIAAWRRPKGPLRRVVIVGGFLLAVSVCLASVIVLSRGSASVQPSDNESVRMRDRLASFATLGREGSLGLRLEVYRMALAAWRESPWIGWGIGASKDMFRHPNKNNPAWIPNLFIHHLFDCGAIGLFFLVGGLGATLWRGLRAWHRAEGARRRILAGTLLALGGLLVAFQSSEATWLAYPWIYLGLLEGAIGEPQESGRRSRAKRQLLSSPPKSGGVASAAGTCSSFI